MYASRHPNRVAAPDPRAAARGAGASRADARSYGTPKLVHYADARAATHHPVTRNHESFAMAYSAHRPAADEAVTRAVAALRRIVLAVRLSARRAERELGLSGAQLFVLQQLGASPVHSLNELAERTRTHQSSVSVVVRRLVARGLVTRTRATDD